MPNSLSGVSPSLFFSGKASSRSRRDRILLIEKAMPERLSASDIVPDLPDLKVPPLASKTSQPFRVLMFLKACLFFPVLGAGGYGIAHFHNNSKPASPGISLSQEVSNVLTTETETQSEAQPLEGQAFLDEIKILQDQCPADYEAFLKVESSQVELEKLKAIEGKLKTLLVQRQVEYNRIIQASRVNPADLTWDPLPKNVMVVASSAQRELSFGNLAGEKLNQIILKAPSLGQAVQEFSYCTPMDRYVENNGNRKLYVPPNMQTSVTTRRDEPRWETAIRKADNLNPNTRRVLVLVWTKDDRITNPINFEDNANQLAKLFPEQSITEYQQQPFSNQEQGIRVDKVIRVGPLTEIESKAGITMQQKIEKAYKEAKAFVDSQRKQAKESGANPKKLKFEMVQGWWGHGGARIYHNHQTGWAIDWKEEKAIKDLQAAIAFNKQIMGPYLPKHFSFKQHGEVSDMEYIPRSLAEKKIFNAAQKEARQLFEKHYAAFQQKYSADLYHEGLGNFLFDTGDKTPLDEGAVKKLDRTLLKDFETVFRIYGSCHSGAAISDAADQIPQGLLAKKLA